MEENRVRNMHQLAAHTMEKALSRDLWLELHTQDVYQWSAEYASIKAQARMAFRFAMKAAPVPIGVLRTLSQSFDYHLARYWNVRPPGYILHRFAGRTFRSLPMDG